MIDMTGLIENHDLSYADRTRFEKMTEYPRVGKLENAPPWWPNWEGQEFTESDRWEIERYCNKIKENVSKDKGMTPKERWKTIREFGIPDRPIVCTMQANLTYSRVLDGWSDTLKPGIDFWWYPKIAVKAYLAWPARFKTEWVHPFALTYGEVEWGGKSAAKLVPYGAIAATAFAVQTEADVDSIHIPDVYRDGFYPPFLWQVRKTREFMTKHGVRDIMIMKSDFCGAPSVAGMTLRGMKNYTMDLKRNLQLNHKLCAMDLKKGIAYGRAVWEAVGGDTASAIMGCCNFGPFMGLETYKKSGVDEYDLAIGKAVGQEKFVWQTGFDQSPGLEYTLQTGSVPSGWMDGPETPIKLQREMATKYKKIFCCFGPDGVKVVTGPPEVLVEQVTHIIDVGAGPGFWVNMNTSDYWSKQEYIDLIVKTAKEHSAEVYKKLR